MNNIPKPLNVSERYQYEQLIRLDALCNMMSSLIEHLASKDNVAVTNNKVVETKSRKKKVENEPSTIS